MTYFHINLDPRGKPPVLIPVIIMEFLFLSIFYGFLFFFFFSLSGLLKFSGRSVGDLQLEVHR